MSKWDECLKMLGESAEKSDTSSTNELPRWHLVQRSDLRVLRLHPPACYALAVLSRPQGTACFLTAKYRNRNCIIYCCGRPPLPYAFRSPAAETDAITMTYNSKESVLLSHYQASSQTVPCLLLRKNTTFGARFCNILGVRGLLEKYPTLFVYANT